MGTLGQPNTPDRPYAGSSSLALYSLAEDDVFTFAARGWLYAVLDAAGAPAIVEKLGEEGLDAQALYESRLNPDLNLAAPYLVHLNADLMDWIYAEFWPEPWGILVECELGPRDLRRHLRRFLIVEGPDGKPLYFRFYDPRVLRMFLPTCTTPQLSEFFGPMEACIARGDPPGTFTRYALRRNFTYDDRTALSAEGRLRVRPEQWSALAAGLNEAFVRRMVGHLRDDFKAELRQHRIPETALEPLVRRGMTEAETYGIVNADHVELYIEFMAILGPGFDHDPRYERFGAILRRRDLQGGVKVEAICERLSERPGAGGGAR